jgi:hypothetical protein
MLSLVVAIISVSAFAITEDITLPVVLLDQWTYLMAATVAIQAVFTVLALRKRSDGDDEEDALPPTSEHGVIRV